MSYFQVQRPLGKILGQPARGCTGFRPQRCYLEIESKAIPGVHSVLSSLIPAYASRFTNLEIVHLDLRFLWTVAIDTLLRRLTWSHHPKLRQIILDFGLPDEDEEADLELPLVAPLYQGAFTRLWWAGQRSIDRRHYSKSTAMCRLRELHLFRTPVSADATMSTCLTRLSIVDCRGCQDVTLFRALVLCARSLTRVCYVGHNPVDLPAKRGSVLLELPKLTHLSLEMHCDKEQQGEEASIRRLVRLHEAIATPALTHLGVGALMLSPIRPGQLARVIRSRLREPNHGQLKCIICNHEKPEKGINGYIEDTDSDYSRIVSNRRVVCSVERESGWKPHFHYIARCDYLDKFRGEEVEGFYPEDIDLFLDNQWSDDDGSSDDTSL